LIRRVLYTYRRAIKDSLIALLVAIVLLEIGLRLVHGWMMDHYKLDRVFSGSGSFKMLFVGDSFVAGAGSDSGLGFPEYLKESLQAEGKRSARSVEVVNIALSGTDTGVHRRRLDLYLDHNPIRPDLVFLITGSNNFTARQTRGPYCREFGNRGNVSLVNRVIYHSMILSFLDGVVFKGGGFPFRGDAAEFTSEQFKGYVLERFRTDLVGIAERMRQMGIQLVFGTYIRFGETDRLNLPVLRSVSDQDGVPLLNIYSEELDEGFRRRGLYSRDSWHPNDEGYQVLAAVFLARLRGTGLLDGFCLAGADEAPAAPVE
jgi:lysophospholipase L1-like esterase